MTTINNLIIGKLYIDHGGVMRVVNRSTGMQVPTDDALAVSK